MAHSGIGEAKKIIDELYKKGHVLSIAEKLEVCKLLTTTSYRGHKDLVEILLKE